MTLEEVDTSINLSSKEVKAVIDNPYVSNPYHDVILPGTATGLTLYLVATKSIKESKRMSLSTKECLEIKTLLKQAGSPFG